MRIFAKHQGYVRIGYSANAMVLAQIVSLNYCQCLLRRRNDLCYHEIMVTFIIENYRNYSIINHYNEFQELKGVFGIKQSNFIMSHQTHNVASTSTRRP